jgi:hypothetical protein
MSFYNKIEVEVTAAEEYTINHGDFGCLGVR